MTLYFYTMKAQCRPNLEYERVFSCVEAEARETAKLYLPTQDDTFPCHLRQLSKGAVDTGKISDNWLVLTKPDEEAARAVWRRYFEESAEILTCRAENCRRLAEENRKIAASL